MNIDNALQFCNAAALPSSSSSVGSNVSPYNVIDLSYVGRYFAADPMKLYFIWTGTPVGTSIQITLRSGATPTDLTSSPSVHWSSGIIPAANYAVNGFGSGLPATIIALPNGGYNPNLAAGTNPTGPYKLYLGLYITVVGDTSAGILTSGLCRDADQHAYAPSGYTV